MTHPPAGPSTPPPPSGPRFGRLTEYLRQITTARADKALAAELAGARGRSASPLDDMDRIANYWQQNGHTKGLTPKQRRRAEHKTAGHFCRQPA